MKNVILWDLDGTLTNPRLGILRCFQYALQEHKFPVPPIDELLWVIGPPLHHSFAMQLPQIDETQVWALVASYRERFGKIGLFENSVYAGVPELLSALPGRKNFLATSKPVYYARQIISHYGLRPHFHQIYGSQMDGRLSDKGELIHFILTNETLDSKNALMIGDRKHDIIGAKKVGVTSVGVTWGYGSTEELNTAEPDFICKSPIELLDLLNQLNQLNLTP